MSDDIKAPASAIKASKEWRDARDLVIARAAWENGYNTMYRHRGVTDDDLRAIIEQVDRGGDATVPTPSRRGDGPQETAAVSSKPSAAHRGTPAGASSDGAEAKEAEPPQDGYTHAAEIAREHNRPDIAHWIERAAKRVAAVSAPESALQAPDQSGGPQDAALGEHRLHAGKEAEPPQLDDACNPAWERGYLQGRADAGHIPSVAEHFFYRDGIGVGKRGEHARAVAILRSVADLELIDGPCWCYTRAWVRDLHGHREHCRAARAYCEEEP